MATGFKTLKRQDSHQERTLLPLPPAPHSSTEPRKDGTAQEEAVKASTLSFLRQVKEKDAQRDQLLRSIMMGGIRKGEKVKRRTARGEHNSQVMAMRQARATFPVTLKVEHCALQRDPGNILRPGKVVTSESTDKFSIKTLFEPFKGSQSVEATSFEGLRHTLKRIYDVRFKDGIHRHHQHPSQKDGPIIEGEIRIQLWRGVEEWVLNEQNWHEALALLACQQLRYSHNGKILGKQRLGTIVASLLVLALLHHRFETRLCNLGLSSEWRLGILLTQEPGSEYWDRSRGRCAIVEASCQELGSTLPCVNAMISSDGVRIMIESMRSIAMKNEGDVVLSRSDWGQINRCAS